MPEYRMPGVYVEELTGLPPAVTDVATAVPLFIGYTAQAGETPGVPQRIRSLAEFEIGFGKWSPCRVGKVEVDKAGRFRSATIATDYYLYDALRLFYANGGGNCCVVSVGTFAASGQIDGERLLGGLSALASLPDASLLVVPDAAGLDEAARGRLHQAMLARCAEWPPRFALVDLGRDDRSGAAFRRHVGSLHLRHGAAYAPWLMIHRENTVRYADLRTRIARQGEPVSLRQLTKEPAVVDLLLRLDALLAEPLHPGAAKEIARLERALLASFAAYRSIVQGVAGTTVACPPSGAIAGIYARVDRERGVWKAPANIVVNGIAGLFVDYTEGEQAALNSDTAAGKSINAIRQFPGRGWLVWGARTLAGNDAEWRYVSVRRFCNMVETSIRQAAESFVFEPNDAATWHRLSATVDNYLVAQWRAGALPGSRPEEAFFVRCGLGQTMTAQDIAAGRLIFEIGLALVRPAEFIVLRSMLQMSES